MENRIWLVGGFFLSTCLWLVTESSAQTRIMPLGDSITEAAGGHASYRYWLWRDLAGGGYDVDFVGSQRGVYNGVPKYPDFDQDHEGHWGWRADQVLERIRTWASEARPEIVLVHLGHNDLWQGSDVAATRVDLLGIVAALREVNPRVVVLLALVIPSTAPQLADLGLLNQSIKRLAASLDTPGSPVIAVDQWAGFDAGHDTYDGVHPNEVGERKMATRWFAALAGLGDLVRRRSPPAPRRAGRRIGPVSDVSRFGLCRGSLGQFGPPGRPECARRHAAPVVVAVRLRMNENGAGMDALRPTQACTGE